MTDEEWDKELERLELKSESMERDALEACYVTAMMNWWSALDRIDEMGAELRMARGALHILVVTGLVVWLFFAVKAVWS